MDNATAEPELIERRRGQDFTTWWHCPVPAEGARFRVLRDEWTGTNDAPVRHIYEIQSSSE